MSNLLLIEDDDTIRAALERGLTGRGHRVRSTATGIAGLEEVLGERPDVVLLDLGLPGYDGFEVARRLRQEHGQAMRIIAVSAYASENDRLQSMEAGCELHLVKPADPRFIESLLG